MTFKAIMMAVTLWIGVAKEERLPIERHPVPVTGSPLGNILWACTTSDHSHSEAAMEQFWIIDPSPEGYYCEGSSLFSDHYLHPNPMGRNRITQAWPALAPYPYYRVHLVTEKLGEYWYWKQYKRTTPSGICAAVYGEHDQWEVDLPLLPEDEVTHIVRSFAVAEKLANKNCPNDGRIKESR